MFTTRDMGRSCGLVNTKVVLMTSWICCQGRRGVNTQRMKYKGEGWVGILLFFPPLLNAANLSP